MVENRIRDWLMTFPGLVVSTSPQAVLREAMKLFTAATSTECDLPVMTDSLWRLGFRPEQVGVFWQLALPVKPFLESLTRGIPVRVDHVAVRVDLATDLRFEFVLQQTEAHLVACREGVALNFALGKFRLRNRIIGQCERLRSLCEFFSGYLRSFIAR